MDLASQRFRSRHDLDILRLARDVRNILVHERVELFDHPAVPSRKLLSSLENLEERLRNPARAIPTFATRVATASLSTSLAEVLRVMGSANISQLPIYSGSRFRGLLTENGVTRWLTAHIDVEMSLVDFEDVSLSEVLREEEERPNCAFVPRSEEVESLVLRFRKNDLLEAVLITQNGRQSEKPIGIATRWDMVSFA